MIPVLNAPTTNSWPRWLLAFSLCTLSFANPSFSLNSFSTGLPAHAEEAEYSEQVYLSEAQALKQVFGGLQVETRTLTPTAAQRKALQKHLRRKLDEPEYKLYVGKKSGKIARYALILDEKGKHYPITFIVAMTPNASVDQVAVMVYRERRGDGVKRQRFLKQFSGKNAKDALEVNRDIVHITGSTISSWSIAAGVRKAVALLEMLVV
jgi:Na+-translocating ferredoxin:NAD+ oxidoreductase subunit G